MYGRRSQRPRRLSRGPFGRLLAGTAVWIRPRSWIYSYVRESCV